MRLRRLSTVFWAICIFAFIFILYVVTDLTFKLPSIKPAMQIDDDKWSQFEIKLNAIENELNRHHMVVGEIKNVVSKIVLNPPQAQKSQYKIAKEDNAVIREPPYSRQEKKIPVQKIIKENKIQEMLPKPNMSHCPFRKEVSPKTDIQMLTLYERISFDDLDGGVWKQGWNIEYNENQWSHANKLKVFIVPHSHNDPGWTKTFEEYYKTQTKAIFTNMVEKLNEVPGRKFIWCETSFLSLWWTLDATDAEKATFLKLLKSGNIEIVTGGWVMNDEANSHWVSVAQQLTAGHQWLLQTMQYAPRNHWSIDPFGYSSSQPYLLKLAGFRNSVIQRVHYRIKKELAMNRELEFKWRQLWDGVGDTDMFTHMMPFYSYDVPHTCGPDPKVCCQFDFKRLPGNGVTCPWGIPPRKIIPKNVKERAFLILDQWRKKAQLFRSNVVLVPLGDDFRYDRANEWDNQFRNYEALIDYINNYSQWNTEVQFGTLEDYFASVHSETKRDEFPVLSGDFFTYADRNQHYWSGYYTSRPFYKAMDRVLLSYVRGAEIMSSRAAAAAGGGAAVRLRDLVQQARRTLALFQHHDGVTGTSRDHVREDYAKKMLQAIKLSQSAIQLGAWYLLGQPQVVDKVQEDIFLESAEVWRRHDELPHALALTLDALAPARRLVLYNALAFARTDILTVTVNTPHVEVFDSLGEPIMSQVSPVVSGEQRLGFAANKFHVSFPASAPAAGLAVYTVALRGDSAINKYTSYARVRIYNADYWTVDLPKMFPVEMNAGRLEDDVTLAAGNRSRIVCTKNGLLKALTTTDGKTFPLNMDFVSYDTLHEPDNNSGAYLFIPSGPAEKMSHDAYPEMVAIEGQYRATLHTALATPRRLQLLLALSVYNNPTLPVAEVWASNTLLLDAAADDLEVAMRLSSGVGNGDVFYTDLNGMQMIKRRYFEKLPLQANFYPVGSAAYIQDAAHRLTLLTSTPLGFAALQTGEMQIMQDRRLSRDDNRGLAQGVLDNVRTRHTFRILVENIEPSCASDAASAPAHGALSLAAHVAAQALLQPLLALHYSPAQRAAPPAAPPAPRSRPDIVLAAFNVHVSAQTADGKILQGTGLTFQRVQLDSCFTNHHVALSYPIDDSQVDISEYVDVEASRVFGSTLSFNQVTSRANSTRLALCPMQVRSVFLHTD